MLAKALEAAPARAGYISGVLRGWYRRGISRNVKCSPCRDEEVGRDVVFAMVGSTWVYSSARSG